MTSANNDRDAWRWRATPAGRRSGGTLTVTAANGVATFSGLTLTTAATGYTLGGLQQRPRRVDHRRHHRDPRRGHAAGDHAAAAGQRRREQPVRPASVAVEDAYGNVVTSASNTVKVAFANNPTGAKLGGTLSVKASQGVATFSGLTINKVGSGYTLQLTSSGLTSAITNAITVTKTGTDVQHLLPAPPTASCTRSAAGTAGARQPGFLGQPGTQEAHTARC